MNTAKMKNEKPSKFKNIGQDIEGAARHNRDTYDNETRAVIRREKRQKDDAKAAMLLELASADQPLAVIKAFELGQFCRTFGISQTFNETAELRAWLLSVRSETEALRFSELAKAFNKVNRKLYKAKYLSTELQRDFYSKKTKEVFHEQCGSQRPWATELSEFDLERLNGKVKAVQFGNSLSDNERLYCLSELSKAFDVIEQHFNLDLSKIGFAFGSRGKAGSVAHYSPSHHTLAFNRGWIGAFAHELGHAIDYQLGQVSHGLPNALRSVYWEQIKDNPNRKYYFKRTEQFARMFEVYCAEVLGVDNAFFLTPPNESVMPKLCAESKAWIEKAMGEVLKGKAA